jgi:hypothetical protein
MTRIFLIASAALFLTGCLTLKPNERADGAVFLEFPIDTPPVSNAHDQGRRE